MVTDVLVKVSPISLHFQFSLSLIREGFPNVFREVDSHGSITAQDLSYLSIKINININVDSVTTLLSFY